MVRVLSLLSLTVLGCASVPLAVEAQAPSDLISELEIIASATPFARTVALGSFTYLHDGADAGGTSFSRYLEDVFAQAISQVPRLDLVTGALSVNYSEDLSEGFPEGLDMHINSRFYEDDQSVRVNVTVVDYGLSQSPAFALRFLKSQLPPQITIAPPDPQGDVDRIESLVIAQSDEVLPPLSRGQLSVTTNRGDNGVFFDGEQLSVYVRSSVPGYLRLYHVDVYGKTTLIFPNGFQPNNYIPGSTTVSVPPPNNPRFRFVLHEPFGQETIKAVFSEQPFTDRWNSDGSTASAQVFSRGLSVTSPYAEAEVSYRIQQSY